MTDETPNTNEGDGSEILDELREMGRNLRDALQSAWDSDERKKLQQELEDGLTEVSSTLNQAARDFKDSPAGQNLKSDVADFQERLNTGEVSLKVRSEIVEALRVVNTELRKVSKKED
jgi:NTP pyrophosphatase (non-canonical NTP hydrolase)